MVNGLPGQAGLALCVLSYTAVFLRLVEYKAIRVERFISQQNYCYNSSKSRLRRQVTLPRSLSD